MAKWKATQDLLDEPSLQSEDECYMAMYSVSKGVLKTLDSLGTYSNKRADVTVSVFSKLSEKEFARMPCAKGWFATYNRGGPCL